MITHEFDDLLGHIFTKVENIKNETLRFTREDGEVFEFYHKYSWCELVRIEDICGDLEDLENSPILIAECNSNHNPMDDEKEKRYEFFAWSFYKFATNKGYVDIRWFSGSNGCYSEIADFRKVNHAGLNRQG